MLCPGSQSHALRAWRTGTAFMELISLSMSSWRPVARNVPAVHAQPEQRVRFLLVKAQLT